MSILKRADLLWEGDKRGQNTRGQKKQRRKKEAGVGSRVTVTVTTPTYPKVGDFWAHRLGVVHIHCGRHHELIYHWRCTCRGLSVERSGRNEVPSQDQDPIRRRNLGRGRRCRRCHQPHRLGVCEGVWLRQTKTGVSRNRPSIGQSRAMHEEYWGMGYNLFMSLHIRILEHHMRWLGYKRGSWFHGLYRCAWRFSGEIMATGFESGGGSSISRVMGNGHPRMIPFLIMYFS